jgi:DNA-3-methyladenine glycosylase II
MPRGFDLIAAAAELGQRDPLLAHWIERLGPLAAEPRWRRPFDTVDALARSILYQQLSGKAAATIVGRVELAAGQRRLDAHALDAVDDATLRGCGVSGNKLLALRDLARRHLAGQLPSPRQMARMDNETIIDALSAVRGIGRWTAEMLLIFRLGRPDVLPLDDLGVRKGMQIVDALDALPNGRQLAQRGAPWQPYRTLASLYLWRVADTRVPD